MATIGKLNNLRVVKKLDFGVYLDGEEFGEILLPRRYVPETCEVEDNLEVFIYFDSEDRIIATTLKPMVMVDEFAYLKVVSVNSVGAFLDWGLAKDLLVPFREQKQTMEEGKWYIVFVYLDKDSRRIAGSAKIEKFLDNIIPEYQSGDEVDVLIANESEIGYNAIINNTHWGILYKNEVFSRLQKGLRTKAYIKKIREDEKIDLSLQKPGYAKIDDVADLVLTKLKMNNGYLPVNDKTKPELIYQMFGISKKAFKMAVGTLYKLRIISLLEDGIKLNA